MKFAQVFLVLVLFAGAQLLEAGGGSQECQKRRDTCGGLVQPNEPSEESGENPPPPTTTTTKQPSTAGPVSNPTVSLTFGSTPSGGLCVCEDATTESQSEATQSVTGSGEVSSGPVSTSKKPRKVPSCKFTEAMWNISLTLSVEYQLILQQWIYEVEYTILVDYKSYSSDQLVVLLGYSLKNFSLTYTEIWEQINFAYIADWGYCIDFVYVAYEIQLEITAEIVELDSSDNCHMFEAIRNASKASGNSDVESDCEDLIAELTIILKKSGWSYEQKLAACYKTIQFYFEANIELKIVLEKCSINGFGSFESFVDVCLIYERTTTLSVVIGGSTSDCVVLKELENVYNNVSVELTVRNQIKQLHDKLLAYFQTTTTISLRLKYVSEQCYSFFTLVNFNVKIVNEIKLGSWGSFYDLLFCSHICTNCGCGNPDDGPGVDATTVGPTTEAAQTTEAATTEAPTTVVVPTTQKPADCSNKNAVVQVNADNTTWLINHLQENYNTWNATTKTGFNSYFNQIKSYSYNFTLTIEQRVSSCQTALRNYNSNNVYKQQVVWNITITEWFGTVGQFCQC